MEVASCLSIPPALPCPALLCGRCIQSFYQTWKRKKPANGGNFFEKPAGRKNSRLPCRCLDRWWSTPASHLAVPLVGTHACRYAASESPPTPLPPLPPLLPQTPPWMDSFANPRKAPQQTPLLAATLSRKSLWEEQKTKARLVAAARERSLAPSSERWRARNEKQTNPLARSLALPRARAIWRRLPPPPLQPCRPATIQPTVTAAGFSVVNWTVVNWILL